MAFDGITVAAIAQELKQNILGGRIAKIAQPEEDELLLTIKSVKDGQRRLLLSASATLPLVYFSTQNKPSPITAPNFCMLLRKHISNGRIVRVTQPDFERILCLEIEHLDELGDLRLKKLVIELMGKHSNIIFLDEKDMIIDAIKHIPGYVSSVREVLPGRAYFIPKTMDKQNPLEESFDGFAGRIKSGAMPVYKALYGNYTGLSPFYAHELCFEAGLDGDMSTDALDENGLHKLFEAFEGMTEAIKGGSFSPLVVYENGVPYEYSGLKLSSFSDSVKKSYESMSSLIESFYQEKALVTRIRQKSVDLRRIVETILERDIKKYDLQLKQMKDTERKDKYKIYGELLNTYGYCAKPGDTKIRVLNYYTNEELDIPLDGTKTALENAQRYFDKYNKLKRTYEALSELTKEVKAEIEHLESLENALEIAVSEDDLSAIKEEMIRCGYIRRKGNEKQGKLKSEPFHYVTKEGFHIYVGKNNIQNEELTFKVANGNDWWFHAKKLPGSHVIVKTEGRELPDSVFEDAARLAAHYSKGRGADKVEVDYVRRKEVKHPNGSKPGFVVYYTNYSMLIDTDISSLTQV